MQPFVYTRATDLGAALAALRDQPGAAPIAGGTELVNWMKEGIARPAVLVDINALPGLDGIEATADGLHLGALARMSDVAAHPDVQQQYPAIAEALLASASTQLRNMASMGGNLLQRTRCPYFRAEVDLPCNKRRPGSGCAALTGLDRGMAIFGWSEQCVATSPSDVAVALAALEATVHTTQRTIPLLELYRSPADGPERDHVLEHGELIVGISVPASPSARRSRYLKVRERASYEFALVSAAVGLDLDEHQRIRTARIALGGVAHRPWRLEAAEQALVGASPQDAREVRGRLEAAFAEARPRQHNGFKIELGLRTVVRTIQMAGT